MFAKIAPVLYSGRFKKPLEGVGNFSDPTPSMFDQTPPKKERERETERDSDAPIVSGSESPLRKTPRAVNTDGSPLKTAKNGARESSQDEGEGQEETLSLTHTVKTGRIQFTGIPLPPEAPTDLLCEECERETAIYFCGACAEVFCFKCCDLCHPRISANDLMHAHERDGRIRGLIFGDTSRFKRCEAAAREKNERDTFYLPDNWCSDEELSRVRDLSRPNSLSTSLQMKERDAANETRIQAMQELVKQSQSENYYERIEARDALPLSLTLSLSSAAAVREKPQYSAQQMVLFRDPATQKESYGVVVSQWDFVHGESAPAVVRGAEENASSNDGSEQCGRVFYYVQMLGELADVDDLETLFLSSAGERNKGRDDERHRKHNISVYDESARLVKEIGDAPLRKEREIAQQLSRRLKELQNLLVLGPKYHLRDVSQSNGKAVSESLRRERVRQHEREEEGGGDDSYSSSSCSMLGNDSLAFSQDNGGRDGDGERVREPLRHHQNLVRGRDAEKLRIFQEKLQRSDSPQDPVVNTQNTRFRNQEERRVIQRRELLKEIKKSKEGKERVFVTDTHDTNLGERPLELYGLHLEDDNASVNTEKYPFARPSNEEVLASIPRREVDKSLYKGLDLSLYADIDIDDQSLLSHYNENQRPLPAALRSHQHLVRDKLPLSVQGERKSIVPSHRVMPSLRDVASLEDSSSTITHTYPYPSVLPQSAVPADVDVEKEMMRVLLLSENELEAMEKRVELYKHRQRMLLEQAMNKNDFIWLRVQVKLKFNVWKKSLLELKEKKRHYCARKIQTRARVWLCRNSLQEARDYWTAYRESQRNAVHAQFRYAQRGDKYAVSFNNKLYFRTLTDMNRYAAVLRVSCTRIGKYCLRKRSVLMRQAWMRWRDAIYVFLESSLKNHHIQIELFLEEGEEDEGEEDHEEYPPGEAGEREKERRQRERREREVQRRLFAAQEEVLAEKMRIVEQHQQLVEFVSPLYQRVMSVPVQHTHHSQHTHNTRKTQHALIASPNQQSEQDKDQERGQEKEKKKSTKKAQRLYQSECFDEFSHNALSTLPLRIQRTQKTHHTSENTATGTAEEEGEEEEDSDEDSEHSQRKDTHAQRETETDEPHMHGEHALSVPGYDPQFSFGAAALPPLLRLSRPKTFRDRLYHDLQQQLHMFPSSLRREYRRMIEEGEEDTQGANRTGNDISTNNSSQVRTETNSMRTNGTAGTATTRAASAKTSKSSNVSVYKSMMRGPTTQSYWLIPQLLMVGNAPLGAADSTQFLLYDEVFHSSVAADAHVREQEVEKRKKLRGEEKGWKKKSLSPTLSAMSALLLVGVNVFISLMSEEEENALLYFHDETEAMEKREQEREMGKERENQPHFMRRTVTTLTQRKESETSGGDASNKASNTAPAKTMGLAERLENELFHARRTSLAMIADYTRVIRKQQIRLSKIPRFGKTDPRYANAHRELLRCEARISLARANIVKIRQQMQFLPKRVVLLRLPVSEFSCPWTRDMVLPSLWMLEHLLMRKNEQIESNIVRPETEDEKEERGRRESELAGAAQLLSSLADSNPVVDQSLIRSTNKNDVHESTNVFFETKIAEKSLPNIYYLFGGGPHALHEDGVSKDGRAGLLAAMALGRLYRLDPQEALYRLQRAHDAMEMYSPKEGLLSSKPSSVYKSPVPPLPWMRALLNDVLHLSHRALAPVAYRMRSDPDTFSIAQEEKNYTEDGRLKINNLNYDHQSAYDERDQQTLRAFDKGVVSRGGVAAPESFAAETVPSTIASEKKSTVEDENQTRGSAQSDDDGDSLTGEDSLVRRILLQKEYVEDFPNQQQRLKRSLYFRQDNKQK